jgi:A/G-specific adenine glycosylase
MLTLDIPNLKSWFLSQKRDLPWRDNPSPYTVWISEVMLQQTQVSVVVSYYERWMKRFPTITQLADASLEEVIKEWEGLGYYSRARNLHAAAKYLVKYHHGELPNTKEHLEKIKGLGPYTVGAILSFAFHQRFPAVDGNVLRVLTRYFKIEEDISKAKTVNAIRNVAAEALPEEESWLINEALIELGATVCQRKPKCEECPMRKTCASYIAGTPELLPIKSAKVQIQRLHRAVAVVSFQGKLLVMRGEEGQIMSDLHEFPYFETTEDGLSGSELKKKLQKELGLDISLKESLPCVKHSFTRYRVFLQPYHYLARREVPVKGYQWLTLESLDQLAFSSGHRQIMALYRARSSDWLHTA